MDLKPFQTVAEVNALALSEAYRHQPEPLEAEFAQLACDCPDACSCAADYPAWAAALTARPTYHRPQEAS